MNDTRNLQLEKLRDARKKLAQVATSIDAKTKELNFLKREKKNLENLIEAYEDSLRIQSFGEDGDSYAWTQELNDKLHSVFDIASFRGLQETVINCTLSQQDCLYIAATGTGKSLVFQLPALISTGVTLVISPLLSLMEDQVNQLAALGIPALVINGNTTLTDFKRAMRAMIDPNEPTKLIYVTPEKLNKSKTLMPQIQKMYQMGRFSRLVIDEVHCCSEWGHDFRKDYSALHIFKSQYPETPILGLTATATPQVIMDIKTMLKIPHALVFKSSFYRPNLIYEMRSFSSKDNTNDVVDLIKSRFSNQCGIIYCLTIKDTEDVASKLTSLGVHCLAYHAQLDNQTRNLIQSQWYNNRCQVIAATVAFGLGINKMDVRFVIHYSISKSLENYYQETGRAGRDGKPAHCVCFYKFADFFRATSITFGDRHGKERVYKMMSYCLNRHQCRKKLIALHFEDQLVKSADDKNCCDNCRFRRTSISESWVDASDWLNDVVEILNQAQRVDEKMTSTKLIDAWLQVKGPKRLRLEGVNKPTLTRTDCETVVGHLICDGFLIEDFHITPYNVISYIKPGVKYNMLSQGRVDKPKIHSLSLESYVQL